MRKGLLPAVLLAYVGASFFHYAHNAEFLGEYPNMPAWLSPLGIYAAGIGSATIGLAGYLLHRVGYRLTGLALLASFALVGFDSLMHYTLAPPAAHSLMMNFSIGLEAATAAALLIVVASLIWREFESKLQ